MARRKHKKHHTRRRRSRGMGAIGTGMGDILGVVAGAVLGKFAQSKLSASVNPKILAGGQVVAGMFLPKFVKSPFVKSMGTGMIANGGVTLLTEFGVLSGIGADDITVDYVGGSTDIQTIAGMDGDDMGAYDGSSDIQTIAGIGEDEIGAFEDEMYS